MTLEEHPDKMTGVAFVPFEGYVCTTSSAKL